MIIKKLLLIVLCCMVSNVAANTSVYHIDFSFPNRVRIELKTIGQLYPINIHSYGQEIYQFLRNHWHLLEKFKEGLNTQQAAQFNTLLDENYQLDSETSALSNKIFWRNAKWPLMICGLAALGFFAYVYGHNQGYEEARTIRIHPQEKDLKNYSLPF